MQRGLKFFDWPLFGGVILLTLVGLIMIYSTGFGGVIVSGLWLRQFLALAIGIAGLFFFSRVDYHNLSKNSALIFILAMLFLILVLFFGDDIRGSTRWFDLGLFNIQPSELSKFALIVILAKFFDKNGPLLRKFSFVVRSFIITAVPVFLILIEPDLGSALVHIAIWLGMLIISPMPRRYLIYLLVGFLIFTSLLWLFVFEDYQKDRVHSFLDPTYDPLGRGYNVIQSMVAVGSGGVFGRGLARGLQSQLRFLPERQTDFIFASAVEELGLIGGVLIISLFAFICLRLVKIVKSARDGFGAYFTAGVLTLIFTQMVVNIGMNIGLLPVTGITLPFLSYGGSSLVVLMWLVGVVVNISLHSQTVRFK